jgi:ATP-binding cassette subfamily B protein
VAVVGATGAGKSTLVNLLLGHYRAVSGALRIGGVAPEELDPDTLRRGVAVVPQEPFLFAGSVLDNIVFGRPWVSGAAAREAAAAVGLGRTLGPDGLEMPVLEEGGRLSAGQRQLVTCARALAGNPHLLLLDEATSEVDQGTEALIEAALETLFRGRTSLVVAHRLATVRRADRVLVLHRGRVVEQGDHRELLDRGGIYRKLYELQFHSAAA